MARRSVRPWRLGALWFAFGVASVWGVYWFPVALVIAVVALVAWSLREILVAARDRGPTSALPVPARSGVTAALVLAAISAVSAIGTVLLLSRLVLVAPTPSLSAPIIEWVGIGWYGLIIVMLVGLILQLTTRSAVAKASAAVVLGAGWLGCVIGAEMPVAVREVGGHRKIECLTNVRSLSMALTMYLAENDNTFPRADDWCEALTPYCETDHPLRCPEAPKLDCAFAYNAVLASVMYDALADPSRTIAIFESDSGWNAAGGPELLTRAPRHSGGDNLGFPDGHAIWAPRPRIDPMDREAGYRRAYPDEWGLWWHP